MNDCENRSADAARDAYTRAVAGGASIHVAFALACKAYRALNPDVEGQALRLAVATGIALSREDRIAIEIGGYT
jgi:hypothetical protein